MKFKSKCVQSLSVKEGPGDGVVPPIVTSSTYGFRNADEIEKYFEAGEGHLYSRYGNPTVEVAESLLSSLEGAEASILFSSGMAAISTLFLSLGGSGMTVGVQQGTYGGTVVLLRDWLPKFGIKVKEFSLEALKSPNEAMFQGLALLYLETPINPTLKCVELKPITQVAERVNVPVALDGTFAPPALQQPTRLGVRYVIHSCTKYLGGHSDLLGGAISGSEEDLAPIHAARKVLGGCMSAFDAYLLHRGMRTLAVRMEAHCAHAKKVAEYLKSHPKVQEVYWPGFQQDPWVHEQLCGGGGMVSFQVRGGDTAALKVHDALTHFVKGGSLGGVESLVCLPARMSHRGLTDEERNTQGIDSGLIRLSIGLEDPEDLVADLDQALTQL